MSLFQNLYRKKQADSGTNKQEDYLTELLAYVLQYDITFQKDFFEKNIIIHAGLTIIVDTQKRYVVPDASNQAQPDIVIEGRENGVLKLLIFIENKIGTGEGWRKIQTTDEDAENHWASQLDIYNRVLKKEKEEMTNNLVTHLIYLTRNFEIPPAKGVIAFKHIFWHQIYQILKNVDENPLSITYQFKQYLINLGMNNDNRFSLKDIYELSNLSKDSTQEDFPELFSKMHTFLLRAKKIVSVREIKLLANPLTFLKKYGPYFMHHNNQKINFQVGFRQTDSAYQLPCLYLRLGLHEGIVVENLLLPNWQMEGESAIIKKYYPTDLLKEDGEHFLILEKWIEDAVKELAVHKHLF